MSRKKHFWEGMNKSTICVYFLIPAVFGSMAYAYATLIFAMAKGITPGVGVSKFNKSVLFVLVAIGVIYMILFFRTALHLSKGIEKKQKEGKEIRF